MSLSSHEVVTSNTVDANVVLASSRALALHLESGEPLKLRIDNANSSDELILPPVVAKLLLRILKELSQGNAVSVSPLQAELTTSQAAEILKMSRPHLTKLLDEDVIPNHKVGSHRRIRLHDVLAFKKESSSQRHSTLDKLSALDQELGLY